MEEIKINDYVRTKKGVIVKVLAYQDLTTYDDKGISVTFHSFDTDKGAIADVEIVKHSKNIIDLVEVGDYVNRELVTGIFDIFNNNEEVIGKKLTTEYRTAQYTGLDNRYYIHETQIKTIVTKEQFASLEYRI